HLGELTLHHRRTTRSSSSHSACPSRGGRSPSACRDSRPKGGFTTLRRTGAQYALLCPARRDHVSGTARRVACNRSSQSESGPWAVCRLRRVNGITYRERAATYAVFQAIKNPPKAIHAWGGKLIQQLCRIAASSRSVKTTEGSWMRRKRL